MIDRRMLLFGTAAAAAELAAPATSADTGFPTHRWVKILFVHTGERFNNLYCADGTYIMPAVQQFSPGRAGISEPASGSGSIRG